MATGVITVRIETVTSLWQPDQTTYLNPENETIYGIFVVENSFQGKELHHSNEIRIKPIQIIYIYMCVCVSRLRRQ